jgi:hypothetical protein
MSVQNLLLLAPSLIFYWQAKSKENDYYCIQQSFQNFFLGILMIIGKHKIHNEVQEGKGR